MGSDGLKNEQKSDNIRGKKVKISIKAKLLGSLIPIVLAVISLIVCLININTSRIVLEKSEDLLNTTASSVVNEVTAWMAETITALDVERDTMEYFNLDADAELDYIKHTANQYEAFPAGIYIANTEGELIHASFVPGPEFNVFEKPWYIDGIESEAFMFGSVYFDEDSQSYVVGASGVLKDEAGRIRGVAAADIYLNSISEIVQRVQIEQTGGMFLVDLRTNIIIGHKDTGMVGTVLGEQEDGMYAFVNDRIKNSELGLQTYANGGSKTYIDIMQVPGSDWMTVTYVPNDEIMADLNSLTRSIMVVAAIGILILILCMERMIHMTVRPVKKLSRVITAITEGDFTQNVSVKSSDEIGVMAEGMQEFIVTMRRIISEVSTISNTMGRQSQSNIEVANNLSNASDIQAQSMSEMNQTVNDLSLSISEVAENATDLAHLMEETKERGQTVSGQMETAVDVSNIGKNDMEKLVESMKNISSKINILEKSAGHMDSSVGEINVIVELIHDIAEETNLLSLNATIEAARAGEAGKGFAVVADQIGKLAQTSKSAVENIAKLTENISEQVVRTVRETKESAEAIKESTVIVDETGANFDKIFGVISQTGQTVAEMVERVNRVNDIAVSVAGITEEQSASSQEILANTETMKENARIVNESSIKVAKEAEFSGDSAKQLRKNMSRFNVK